MNDREAELCNALNGLLEAIDLDYQDSYKWKNNVIDEAEKASNVLNRIKQFEDLKIGQMFHYDGSNFVKINDDSTGFNSMYINWQHFCLGASFGPDAEVKIVDSEKCLEDLMREGTPPF